jgi:hypothetical protein
MVKKAKAGSPSFKCTHGAGGMCIECPGFLDQGIHSLVLAHFVSTAKTK